MTASHASPVSPRWTWTRRYRDPLMIAFLITLLISLIRAPDQPTVAVDIGSTNIALDPSDVALVLLAIWLGVHIVRHRDLPRSSWPILFAVALFVLWIMGSAAGNGASAFVAGGKFVELGVLTVATVYVIRKGENIWPLIVALVAMNVAADISALTGFVHNFNARQPSFLGEHDLAALSTMTLSVWFAQLYSGDARHKHLCRFAGVVGVIGVTLGAALASLIGVYLAIAALAAVAVARGQFRRSSFVVTILVAAAITGAVLSLRADNLGFLRAWFGTKQTNAATQPEPGAWSQRLIYAYIGGRVFLTNPILGTGWYPELPPSEYARYLPDARRRFSNQPARYFPSANGKLIPQMAYDQVLYELGLAGAVVFVLLLTTTVRDSWRSGRSARLGEQDALAPYLAPAWVASMLGVLAGIALFGGTTVAALFWLTIGAAAALAQQAGRPP